MTNTIRICDSNLAYRNVPDIKSRCPWSNTEHYLLVIVIVRAEMHFELGGQLVLLVTKLAVEDTVYLFHFGLNFILALSNHLLWMQRAGNGHPGNTAHHTWTRSPEPSPLSQLFGRQTLSCSL